MKLRRARVTDFRSINDSGWVDIEEVACLVGKNESGKTNFLQALTRVNPTDGAGSFNLTNDFPRQRLLEAEADIKAGKPHPKVVHVEYALTPDEQAELVARFGEKAVRAAGGPEAVRVSKTYDGTKYWHFDTDEAAAVQHLAKQHGRVTQAKSLADWIAELEGDPENGIDADALAQIREMADTGLDSTVISWFARREPLFIYFDEYDRMVGEAKVGEVLSHREDRAALEPGQRTFLALLDSAKIDASDLDAGDYEPLKARLESASGNITSELYRFWSQNRTSEIEFDHDWVDVPGQQPPPKELILKVRVKDTRHGVTVSVDRRSNGFVWFFSFLVNFSQIRALHPQRPLVLLLDEPGGALHGLAQRDFLRVIDERLHEHQVIYTTHQPFLVDPNRLDRARPVVDEGEGTKVRNHAYKIDDETLFPLQAALGYEIGQTLFVAPNVLLVEGTSDLIYLKLLSHAVEDAGGTGLDWRWTITPVGGISKMETFVRLFDSNQLNTCALVDVGKNGKAQLDRLVTDGVLTENQIVRVNDFVSQDLADIEDLFNAKFYVELVRGSAKEAKSSMLGFVTAEGLEQLETPEVQITKRIDAFLREMHQGDGKAPRLDHNPPAFYFDRKRAELLPKLDKTTIERAKKLLTKVNAQLAK